MTPGFIKAAAAVDWCRIEPCALFAVIVNPSCLCVCLRETGAGHEHMRAKRVNIQIRITHHLCLVWQKKEQKFGRKSKVVLFLLQERGKAELPVHFYKLCLPIDSYFFPFRHQIRTNMWKSVLTCKDDVQRADSTRCKTMRFTQKVGHDAAERLTNRRLKKYVFIFMNI